MRYIKDLEDFRVFLLGKYIDERNYLISIESANPTIINNKDNPANENIQNSSALADKQFTTGYEAVF
jgi:hypothetical protein